MKLPWRRVAGWHCSACGRCCHEYTPKLTFYEYLKFPKKFTVERSGRYYIKKIGKRCPFQVGRLCGIQNNKPTSCKLFPFSIHRRGEELAYIEFEGEEYYVYVDTFCKNVKIGRAGEFMRRIVEEALKVSTFRKKDVTYLTSQKEGVLV